MATKKGIGRAIQQLRVGGCHNGQLEVDGALGILIEDWFVAFSDSTDDQLRDAGRAWLDRKRDDRGFRAWPSSGDLREVLQAARIATSTKPEGCEECDRTGFRQMLHVTETGRRSLVVAPCDCPRGAKMTNAPTMAGAEPLEPWHVVKDRWLRAGAEVHWTDRNMPVLPLSLTNPEAWERAKQGGAGATGRFVQALRNIAAGAPPNARDVRREAAHDLDPEPTPDPDAWRGEAPF